MKNNLFPISTTRAIQSPLCLGIGGAVIAALVVLTPTAQAQVSDDFSDLNDTANPAWTHLTGLTLSTGQAWDVSGGNYRLTAPNNGFTSGGAQYGFVGSYTGPAMNDTTVSADFVVHAGNGLTNGVYGVAARLDGNNGFNALKGYGYVYEPFAAGGTGEMVLYRINGLSLSDIGSQPVTLDATKDYTFILEVTGSNLHGQVWEIGGGMVAERFATDATYASGFSGLFAYSANPAFAPTDVTLDNFSAVPEPSSMALAGFGLLGLTAMWNARRLKRSM